MNFKAMGSKRAMRALSNMIDGFNVGTTLTALNDGITALISIALYRRGHKKAAAALAIGTVASTVISGAVALYDNGTVKNVKEVMSETISISPGLHRVSPFEEEND